MAAAEIFILFELIGVAFLWRAFDDRTLIPAMIAMVVFFALTPLSLTIDTLFTGALYESWEGFGLNLLFASVSLVLAATSYFRPQKSI